MAQFTLQQVYTAYRRLKNHFYFDNSNLFMRLKIAEFEKDLNIAFKSQRSRNKRKLTVENEIKTLLQPVVTLLNDLYDSMADDDKVFPCFEVNGDLEKKLSAIKCYPIPKELKTEKSPKDYHFITNKTSTGEINVEKCNFMIDAPIFIHIVSVLWIEMVGTKLHPYIGKDNYAYKLNVSENEQEQTVRIKDGLMLFQPYFIGYQTWRDNALNEAKRLLDAGNDVTLLSLDIKRYYYSSRINVLEMLKDVVGTSETGEEQAQIHFLNQLLHLIHEVYQERIEDYLDDEYKTSRENRIRQEYVLPVGLLSSAVLANFFLYKFDKIAVQSVAPSYYGRYVDDILFIFSNRGVDANDDNINPVDEFINRYFCSVDALVECPSVNDNDKSYIVNVSGQKLDDDLKQQVKDGDYTSIGHVKVQTTKVVLGYFDHTSSHAAIDIFLRNLKKNRSEYRFLPTEEVITEEFDHEAYQLLYDDSGNKIRSMKVFNEDKYGAAKYLAKQIYLLKLREEDDSPTRTAAKETVAAQLISFFSGRNAIYMHSLWEKAATYFVLTKDTRSLVIFYNHVNHAIRRVTCACCEAEDLQHQLKYELFLSIAMPMALKPELLYEEFANVEGDLLELHKKSLLLRFSNMFRSSYAGLKGVNLTNALFDEKTDLTNDDISILRQHELQDGLCFMAPQHIRFEELNMLDIYKQINIENSREAESKPKKNNKSEGGTLWGKYLKYSRSWTSLFIDRKDNIDDESCLVKCSPECNVIKDSRYADIKCESDKNIAIVNKRIEPSHFMSVVKYHKPLHAPSRKHELINIINETIRQGAEILVMPELTVPFAWLSFLVERAKHSNIAIVTGMEYSLHDSNKKIVNTVATILPFRDRYLKSCFVKLREKNFYSPKEELLLDAYRYQFRKDEKHPVYDLFHWRKCFFSVFNCFELADIESRALLKSKVDFVIAVEYNKDIHYFSDVVGSWARDIHCFIVQVNSSDYGDSKIIMPSKTEEKTLVHVKGGNHTVVLTSKLSISALRDFQLASYGEQINNKHFKFTPPGFDHDCALKRYNDEEVTLDRE